MRWGLRSVAHTHLHVRRSGCRWRGQSLAEAKAQGQTGLARRVEVCRWRTQPGWGDGHRGSKQSSVEHGALGCWLGAQEEPTLRVAQVLALPLPE